MKGTRNGLTERSLDLIIAFYEDEYLRMCEPEDLAEETELGLMYTIVDGYDMEEHEIQVSLFPLKRTLVVFGDGRTVYTEGFSDDAEMNGWVEDLMTCGDPFNTMYEDYADYVRDNC